MDYIEVTIMLPAASEELKEIIISELAEAGFESFMDTDGGFMAYIPSSSYNHAEVSALLQKRDVKHYQKEIPAQNWNAVWESNFEPVIIDNKCLIRAGFHKNLPSYSYEILIDPKMSFGTGHHETTSLMVSTMLDIDFRGKNVLDMGCGTGILAIMASMLGASRVLGIDIDPWSYDNSVENAERNKISNVTFKMGDASELKDLSFDIILANINRNVLTEDIKKYNTCLPSAGIVVLSGFYRQDIDIIKAEADACRWDLTSIKEKNNWVAAQFIKK